MQRATVTTWRRLTWTLPSAAHSCRWNRGSTCRTRRVAIVVMFASITIPRERGVFAAYWFAPLSNRLMRKELGVMVNIRALC